MSAFATQLPFLLLIPVMYAALVKAAALILHRIKLSWKHALLFGLLAMVVGATFTFANLAARQVVPASLTALFGVAVQLALGSWYFKDRARLASGSSVGIVRGALLPLIAIGFVFVLVTIVGLFPPGAPHSGGL